MPRVLVTGASGFIGSALIPVLVEHGYDVVAAVRSSQSKVAADVPRIPIGDLGARTDWSEALKGVDAVVHLAALAHVPEGRLGLDAYRSVNVQGTESLAREARRKGVRRLVFLSSAGVHGPRTTGKPVAESSPLVLHSAYARSKAEAEDALGRICADGTLEVTILRPPLVYGPGNPGNLARLMRLIDSRVPLPFASIKNRRSLIYSGNLVHAIVSCLQHPAAAGRTFVVRDGEDISTPELIRRLAYHLGRSPRLFPFPVPLLRLAATLSGRGEDVDRLVSDFAVDDSAIRRTLGYNSPYTLDQGLAATAAWWSGSRRTGV